MGHWLKTIPWVSDLAWIEPAATWGRSARPYSTFMLWGLSIGISSQEIFLWELETGYYSVTSVLSPGIAVCNSLACTWSLGEPGHIWRLSSCEENHARQATSTPWQQWCSNGLLVVALLMALLRKLLKCV